MSGVILGPGAPSSISSRLAIAAKAIATCAAMNRSHSGVHKCSLKGRWIARGDPFDMARSLSAAPIFGIQITAVPYGQGN